MTLQNYMYLLNILMKAFFFFFNFLANLVEIFSCIVYSKIPINLLIDQ